MIKILKIFKESFIVSFYNSLNMLLPINNVSVRFQFFLLWKQNLNSAWVKDIQLLHLFRKETVLSVGGWEMDDDKHKMR